MEGTEQNIYFRPLVIIFGLLILFGFSFLPLHAVTKNGAFILSSAFPIIAGWLLGFRLGLLFWLLHAVLLMFLAQAAGSGMDDLISNGIFSYMVTLLMTSGTGRLRDLTKELKHELTERKKVELKLHQYRDSLEKQVEKRTAELIKSNAQLKQEILQNEQTSREKLNLQTSLKRAEKMETAGILAGSVAHDLNNILSGIINYPELLLADLPETSPLREPLLTIKDSGLRAAAVVQDLLALVRKGVVNTQVTNLNQIITDFLKSPECRKMVTDYPGTAIETDLQPDLQNIQGSPIHLSKGVMNLVLNSMEAMTKGGRLVISTANVFVDKPCGSYEIVAAGRYVLLEISDTGSGISKEDVDRIFEPFYTRKVMGRSGTGLGLAIVWGTVKDHKGYVDIRSREGEGTTFMLYFPATDEAVAGKENRLERDDYKGNGESILVIDDVKLQREVCENILKKLGYAVRSAVSGEQAIKYLMNHSVDLLVMDMIMEDGMDGFETYKRIVDMHPSQKAVIVSGFSESEQVKKVQAMGAGAYIKKPYTMETLGIAVKNQLHATPFSAQPGTE